MDLVVKKYLLLRLFTASLSLKVPYPVRSTTSLSLPLMLVLPILSWLQRTQRCAQHYATIRTVGSKYVMVKLIAYNNERAAGEL